MAPARLGTVPIPSPDLAQLRNNLAPQYGAHVWQEDEAGQRILVVRVPRDEPDMVNDIEAAIEYLNIADTRELDQVLLVGGRRIHAVPPRLIEDRMVERAHSDREQAARLRQILTKAEPIRLYRDPRDTHKLLRLGVLVPRATVQEVKDEDLARIADRLGTKLEDGKLRGVRAVYLVAERDDVRLEADMFFAELQEHWSREERLRRTQEELEARNRVKETERRRLLRDLERRFPPEPRVTYAPVRRTSESHLESRRPRDAPKEAVDTTRLAASSQTAPAEGDPIRPVLRQAQAPPERAASSRQVAGAGTQEAQAPGWSRLLSRMEAAGYQLLPHPDVPGHAIDLAAERRDGYPERVVAVFPPRLTVPVADALLATSRALGVDLALAVCEAADPEARKRLVATKVKWVAPHDLDHLSL